MRSASWLPLFIAVCSLSWVPIEAFFGCPIEGGLYAKYLYLQPNGSDLYYGVEAITADPDIAVPAASPNWKALALDQHYHSGFEVGGTLFFCRSGISVNCNWEQLHGHDSDSLKVPSTVKYMLGPLFDIGPNAERYKTARGKATWRFDEVNVNVGKSICSLGDWHTHFFGGVSWARVDQTLRSVYANGSGSISRHVKAPSSFMGVGPQIGLNYDWDLCRGLSFKGSTALSLFIGKIRNSQTFKSFTPVLRRLHIPQPNVQKTYVHNKTQCIPAFEQKLGLSYCASLCGCGVEVEIGYQYQIYLDAVRTVDMTAPQVLPTTAIVTPQAGVFAVGFQKNSSNFILSGPYASFNVIF